MGKTKSEVKGITKASIQSKKDELNVAIPARILKCRGGESNSHDIAITGF